MRLCLCMRACQCSAVSILLCIRRCGAAFALDVLQGLSGASEKVLSLVRRLQEAMQGSQQLAALLAADLGPMLEVRPILLVCSRPKGSRQAQFS